MASEAWQVAHPLGDHEHSIPWVPAFDEFIWSVVENMESKSQTFFETYIESLENVWTQQLQVSGKAELATQTLEHVKQLKDTMSIIPFQNKMGIISWVEHLKIRAGQ